MIENIEQRLLKNSTFSFFPFQYLRFAKKISNFIFYRVDFRNFWPYFNSFISFRRGFFVLGPIFILIADFHRIIYSTNTFRPLIILENEIYYKTIKKVISVRLNMILSAVSVHSPESHWSLCEFAAQSPSI